MPTETYVLIDEYRRRMAIAAVVRARIGMQVKISRPGRTLEQNKHLHALLGDIADQLCWPPDTGELHDLEWWKPRNTLRWLIETKQQPDLITDLESEDQFAYLLPHTSDLNTEQFAALIESTYAFGAKNGVIFKEPRVPAPPAYEVVR